jgi:hypothetical protein
MRAEGQTSVRKAVQGQSNSPDARQHGIGPNDVLLHEFKLCPADHLERHSEALLLEE